MTAHPQSWEIPKEGKVLEISMAVVIDEENDTKQEDAPDMTKTFGDDLVIKSSVSNEEREVLTNEAGVTLWSLFGLVCLWSASIYCLVMPSEVSATVRNMSPRKPLFFMIRSIFVV